jgi:hypothetical protein
VDTPIGRRLVKESEKHPCGRPKIVATRNYKKLGHVKGEVKPCDCILCGPVEARLRKWDWWKTHRMQGNYSCHKCHRVAFCAGDDTEHMWCRRCYLI